MPTTAEVKVERALELFNGSEHQRTVAGLTRTLGFPWATAVPDSSAPSAVTVVVAWELSWYRDRVDVRALERTLLASSGITCAGEPSLADGVGAARDARLPGRLLGLAAFARSPATDPPDRMTTPKLRVTRPRIDTRATIEQAGMAPDGVVSASRALLEVSIGRLTPWQLIEAASQDPASPLRAIPLVQLLLAERDSAPAKADAHLRRLAIALDEDIGQVRGKDVSWLVKANSCGRRMVAWRAVSGQGR